ncbi:hypothetical protein KSP40_PGU006796 [Platanthera guangdongensis]|uniref:Uncharacterized protein n=1 Tax=Platanthera guangdongensis TaxID=2320717 RepID=A0ABR2M9Y7_9ASPA
MVCKVEDCGKPRGRKFWLKIQEMSRKRLIRLLGSSRLAFFATKAVPASSSAASSARMMPSPLPFFS